MTDVAQIALEFCRECLGWEDVYTSEVQHPDEQVYSPSSVIMSGKSTREFHYTDLSAVMSAVRGWCDRMGCGIELHYSSDRSGFGVLCEGVDTWEKDPCQALLTACVEASRRLKP